MKNKKRKSGIKKKSKIATLESPSFFSESTVANQFSNTRKKLSGFDRQNYLDTSYGIDSFMNSEKNRIKKKCSFVVDWQMPDVF